MAQNQKLQFQIIVIDLSYDTTGRPFALHAIGPGTVSPLHPYCFPSPPVMTSEHHWMWLQTKTIVIHDYLSFFTLPFVSHLVTFREPYGLFGLELRLAA